MQDAGRDVRRMWSVARGLVLGGAFVFASAAAFADQVVMPYTCAAYGRQVNLTPSQPRTYEIYGRREQDLVTACAPNDANRCRTWRIHRFDMNCGGSRVPWIDVVDAANAISRGPARVRDGRLYVRMDPWWARSRVPAWADRPKLREFDDGDEKPGNFRYQPSARAPSVEMPPGFAPIVGLNARFTGGDPAPAIDDGPRGRDGGPVANGEPSYQWNGKTVDNRASAAPGVQLPPVTVAPPVQKSAAPPTKPAAIAKEEPSASAATGKTSTRDPGHTFAPKTADDRPAEQPADKPSEAKVAAAPEASTPATTPPTSVAAPAPEPAAAPPTDPAKTAAPVAPSPSAEPTINSIAPTILNRPGAEPAAITSASSSSGDVAGKAAADSATISATLETGANPSPASKSLPIMMGIGAMVLLATALAVFMRRQNDQRLSPANPAARDLSSVSLDAAQSRALARTGPVEPTLSTPAPPPQPPAQPLRLTEALAREAPPEQQPVVTGPVIEPEWLPTTREEALHVLGAGPDASDAVLKKIVDGLRMSWHPDHAKSAEDHRMRSERMTQINVAWDILAGRQPAT